MLGMRSTSPEARVLLAYVEERLNKQRAQLESMTCDPRVADQIRGRIAELKLLASSIHNEDATNE